MSEIPIGVSLDELVVECHHCGARAAVRAGKEYLCPRCAVETGVVKDLALVCDLCDRESLVRLGERFLCASCAMAVLSESAEQFDGSVDARPTGPLVELLSGGEDPVLAHGLEIGTMVRDGAMRLVDAAAAHHQVLARSMRRARDPEECIRRVEAAAVLFNVWAFSFDARLEELELRNDALARIARDAERDLVMSPSPGRRRVPPVGLGNEESWAVETSKDGEKWRYLGKAWKSPGEPVLLHVSVPLVRYRQLLPAESEEWSAPLRTEGELPMTLVRMEEGSREDLWPGEEHLGLPMLLPGGESGRLQRFEHAPDGSSWTYTLEFRGARED
jgi:hypothetical protein